MRIKGVDLPSAFHLNNPHQLEIPFFQRRYVWDEDNWLRLWESIETIVKKKQNPYLGSIIFKEKPKSDEMHEIDKSQIIDGQQRLTTLSIVFRAIFDSIPEKPDKNGHTRFKWKKELIGMLFYEDKNKSSYETKIKHSYIDRNDYDLVIGFVKEDAEGNNSINRKDGSDKILNQEKKEEYLRDHRNILACYLFFKEKLDAIEEDSRWDYFEQLYRCQNLLVRITLEADDRNEQDIFDTINSAGVKLTSYDLIKNNLFSQLMDFYLKEKDRSRAEKDVMSFYDETWKKTFERDNKCIKFWDNTRGHGVYTSTNSEIIVSAYAINKGIFNPNQDGQTRADLPELYRKFVQEKCSSVDSIKVLIEELCSYADIYTERLKPIGSEQSISYEDWEKRLLNMLERISENVFIPYLLHLYITYANDENKLKEKFHELEVFVMRNVTSQHSTKNFNRDVVSFISDESKVVKMSNEISNTDIENGLKNNVSNSSGTLILFWIELYRAFKNQDSKSDYEKTELEYNFTLEHVMPQKWHECWENVPCYNEASEAIENKERDDKKKSKIYSIGNMTLVTQSFNSSLSNRPFTEKVNGWTDKKGKIKKGYKDYSKLSITTEDILKKIGETEGSFVERTEWDERDIYLREKKLISEVIALWGNPQV
ncbi:conserved hypothetical protein [Fibrobacter succinogenes subsp. succinogenes S85]|uniref:Membrane protein n=1 Tax=Fibrobacter succinogenes (strain ATCC 19169 / S85) TaxID=59374 RepID=A7UG49_FIBSS|nr:DUF262 domain-containing protein [Fibrobacter succinogenes]ABU45480.1 membrane protein [Fibrobacter succinogenes subsp. succinogenes S85]ACX75377.1 protein of unknown function DUF262 [Fibrobacter succinogenes subsp. succinogenes S85]ADL27385.1 conserved hypothetical protein [Fibrobacter succinogenes subsp. succinogenes S85]